MDSSFIIALAENDGRNAMVAYDNNAKKADIYLYAYDTHMARTIAVSDEVYMRLKKARMPGESFSSTIKRSLEMRPKLSDIAGTRTLTKKDWREAQRALSKAEGKTLLERDA